jgi:hypothetical protein
MRPGRMHCKIGSRVPRVRSGILVRGITLFLFHGDRWLLVCEGERLFVRVC